MQDFMPGTKSCKNQVKILRRLYRKCGHSRDHRRGSYSQYLSRRLRRERIIELE